MVKPKKGKGPKVVGSVGNREQALAQALLQIEENFGKGAIMKLGERADTKISTVTSGSLALDIALGVGGFPRGRIIEIFGPESSGKTTVALHAIAEVQKQNGVAAFIDAEHALDPEYARALGVDIDELLLSQPDTGEQALAIADALVSSGAVDILIIDSVAALVPQSEIEGAMGASHVGLQARLMSQALRKLSGTINRTKTIAIFINQLREKVGVMFGNPETTPGGRALKFYSSIRLDVRKAETIKSGSETFIGNRTKIKVVKNKVAPPFKTAEVDIMYGEGISIVGELLDMASDLRFVKKGGAWYTIGEERIQGRENAKQYLVDHPAVREELNRKVREYYNILDTSAASAVSGEESGDSQGVPASRVDLEEDLDEEIGMEIEGLFGDSLDFLDEE